jgi:hypothetical protein
MLTLVTPPATAILTTAEAKAHLRVTSSSEDTYIDALVKAATRAAERYTGQAFISQTWRLSLEGIPAAPGRRNSESWWDGVQEGTLSSHLGFARSNFIDLHLAPIVSITSMTTYDQSDTAAVFDAANYFLDTDWKPGRLVLKDTCIWPVNLRTRKSVEVVFVAGYGAASTDVPEDIRMAIRQTVATLYENRGDESLPIMPAASRMLLDPYVVRRIS